MKSVIKIALIIFLGLSFARAEVFDWEKIKQEIEQNNPTQKTEIKKVIEKKYGVTTSKEKLSDIKKKLQEKNTLFGINFKSSTKIQDNGNRTSNFGIFMQSVLDFSSIGYFTTPDMFINILIYTEKIQMNILKRFINNWGFEAFYGAGTEFIQDGYGINRINFHFTFDVSYSYKDYGIELHTIIPLNYTQYIEYYGGNPVKAGVISLNIFKRF